MQTKYPSKTMAAIHETATDLYESGGMDKKTMHNFDALCLPPVPAMTPEQIHTLRAKN
jgi:putative transcriptional regulator